MTNRSTLASTFVIAGILCVAVTVVAVAWVDNVARHERSAELQAAVQIELQGKVMKDLPPYASILSPLMTWLTFGIGAYLVGSGFVMGIRSRPAGVQPTQN